MPGRSLRAVRSTRLLTPLLVFATASAISAGTFAAYSATTSSSVNSVIAGSVSLSDNDSGNTMLGLSNAGAGATDTSCIKVRSDGALPSDLRLHAAVSGPLARYLLVRIQRGTGAAAFDDCSGFAAGPRDYYGQGTGVIYDGRLSDLPTDWTAALRDPSDDRLATSLLPIGTARTNLVGLWEMGERSRVADDFDGVPKALLTGRVEPLLRTTWARQTVSTTNAVLTATGAVRPQAPGTAYYRATTMATAETLSADITVRSAVGEAGIMTRMSTTGQGSGYLVNYLASGTWQLSRLATDGTPTLLASYPATIAVGDTANVVLEQNGGALRVLIDGVARMTATDTTIAATSRSGLRLVGAGAGQDDRTGIQINSLRSYQPNVVPATATIGTAGTVIGAPTRVAGIQPSPTDPQYAGSFNGSSALSLPATGLTTTATIAGWFKLTAGTITMRDSSTGTTAGWSLGYDDTPGGGTMKFRTSGEVFDTGVEFNQLRGNWHHHALVRNGTSVDYYLDGRRVFSGTVAGTTEPVSPFFVMRDGTAAPFSTGSVDQVGIWSRALTAAELAAIRDGVSAPAEWRQGDERWYRIGVTVSEDPAAAALVGTGQFTWEAHNR